MVASEAVGKKFTLSPRQKALLPVVVLGAFFEGFDFMVVNLVLPFITRDLKVSDQTAAYMLSAIAVGALIAFFVVRLADKLGRRPVFLSSVVLYSIFTLLTALAHSVAFFVTCQFIARVFLVVCWAVGFIIMSEEFDPELRGRAIGLFQSAAAIGAIFPSLLLPVVAATSLHWRGLYLIGALPLILLLFMGKNLPETPKFLELKEGKGGEERGPGLLAVFHPAFIKYTLAIMALWFFMYICYSSSMNFFSQHVVRELGWKESQVATVNALAYTLGLLGYFVVGKLLDAIGRKKTAYLTFSLGALAVIGVYQAQQFIHVLVIQIIAVFFVGTFTVICATFTNELFPTSIRANATAWGNNIVGRIGQIVAPALVGMLQVQVHGIGNAVSILALAPFVCVCVVALFLPETLNYSPPEYVQEKVAA